MVDLELWRVLNLSALPSVARRAACKFVSIHEVKEQEVRLPNTLLQPRGSERTAVAVTHARDLLSQR